MNLPPGMRVGRELSALLGVMLAMARPFGPVAHAVSPAATDTDASRAARRRFQSAEVHFHVGEFAEALVDYQAGYDAAPLPGFLVNIAQCQRRLGDLKKARSTYQQFLLVAPDSPLAPDVKTIIAEIDQALLDPTDPPSVGVSPQDERPLVPRPLVLAPQPPAAAQAREPPPAVLVAVAARDPAGDRSAGPTTHPASRTHWWLWGTLAAIAVGGTVGAVALWPPDAVVLHEGSLGTLRR